MGKKRGGKGKPNKDHHGDPTKEAPATETSGSSATVNTKMSHLTLDGATTVTSNGPVAAGQETSPKPASEDDGLLGANKEPQKVVDHIEAVPVDGVADQDAPPEKTREQIMVERQAKKDAKAAKKGAAKAQPKEKPSQSKQQGAPKVSNDCSADAEMQSRDHKAEVPNEETPAAVYNEIARPSTSSESVDSIFRDLKQSIVDRKYPGIDDLCAALSDGFKQIIEKTVFESDISFPREAETITDNNISFLYGESNMPYAVMNLVRLLKAHIRSLGARQSLLSVLEAKREVMDWLSSFVSEHIDLAAVEICNQIRPKLKETPVVLVFARSSLIKQILVDAQSHGISFEVIIVDTPGNQEGLHMVRELLAMGIHCTYVLIAALHYVIRDAHLILLGAESVLANGSILAKLGSNLVALSAGVHNIPVIVACQTYKFSDKVLTGILQPSRIDKNVQLASEVVNAALISGIVTELRILPCSSVPAITRAKLLV